MTSVYLFLLITAQTVFLYLDSANCLNTQALSIAPFMPKSSPSLSLYLCYNILNITNTAKYLDKLY